MFEEFLDIPVHPLLVHAAVVFVPLLVLASVAYAVFGFTRRYIWWAALALAVIAPLAAFFAKLSGDAFRNRKIGRGQASGKFLDDINAHANLGTLTLYWSIGLGVLTLILVLFVARRPFADGPSVTTMAPVVTWIYVVVVVAVGAATLYYVLRTGDSGAHLVWTGS